MSPNEEPPKPGAGDKLSWLPIVLFWIGVGLYHSGIDDWFRDRFFVQPALTKAFDLKSRGGAEIALDLLLEQLPNNPRNPKLLWALGNTYTSMDRPVLAAFYFTALERTGQSSRLDPQWIAFTTEWQSFENPAIKTARRDEERLEAERKQFERDYNGSVIEHPASINSVLSLPAVNAGALAGYIPPDHPAPCGADRPRCGYALDAATGNFWNALETQAIRIDDPRGGPDCCSLSLDDPDLRSLDVAEAEFSLNPEMLDGRLSTATEAGRRVRLAFASRVLLKQRLVLDFIAKANTAPPPDPGWTIWSWAKLIGWIVVVFLLSGMIEDWLDRRRSRRATVKMPESPAVDSQTRIHGPPHGSRLRRVGYSLLALVLALLAASNFANSNRVWIEANSVTGGLGIVSSHLVSKPWPGNAISLAAGVTLLLVALLALNRGWRNGPRTSGPVDRGLGWLSGTAARAARPFAAAVAILAFAWFANLSVRHSTFHFDPTQAARAFKQDVSGLSIRVIDRYVYGLALDEETMHLAAFGPTMVRAFEREGVGYGYLKPRFEFPLPGVIPLLCLVLLCAMTARHRMQDKAATMPGIFLAAGLLQGYVLFWLTSTQSSFDPWWVQAAIPLSLAQLVLLASIHRKICEAALPPSQLAGWISCYFATSILILALAYRVSGAPLLAPAMLWLTPYASLLALLWWLLLPRPLTKATN